MPEHLRAMLVVVFLGGGFFLAARGATASLLPEPTFKRWRNLWLFVTGLLFLSHSIWLFILGTAGVLLAQRRRETQVLGLYFVLLFVAPPAPVEVPGLGVIDHVLVLDYYRLLALALLLPATLVLAQRSSTARLGSSAVDWMVIGYLCLMSLLAFREGNVTSGFRAVVVLWVEVFLPYYVASRSLRSEEDFKQAMTGFLLAAMVVALIALFEMLRRWKLYPAVLDALGAGYGLFGNYLFRSGFLRPSVTVVSPIVVGYLLVVALGFLLYLKEYLSTFARWGGLSLLAIGILASLSRGPWVGAGFLTFLFVLSRPKPLKQLFVLGVAGSLLVMLAAQFPAGQTMIDILPIIGEAEQDNVEYRANLLTAAWPVIERNWLLGSYDYLDAPELQVMMQGEGIIDVVNSYVGVALYAGFLGLFLFVGAFLGALAGVRRAVRAAREQDPRVQLLGRVIWVTLATIMLIIYTVSSVTAVPFVYWSVVGMAVAYARLPDEWRRVNREKAAS